MHPLKRSVRWSLQKLGYELRRTNGAAPTGDRLVNYFRHLKRFGFAPKSIYDIGANRGGVVVEGPPGVCRRRGRDVRAAAEAGAGPRARDGGEAEREMAAVRGVGGGGD